MSKDLTPHHVVDLTAVRRAWLNMMALPRPTLHMYGLLEVDVTAARRFIADYEARSGETLSFTGYLTYCLARAVEEEKSVQTYRKGRTQLLMCDDVHVGLMIERKLGEEIVPMGYVVREANRKTYLQIHREIRSAQATEAPPVPRSAKSFYSAMSLPWPLCRLPMALFGAAMRRDPMIFVDMMGTVGITAVGMFGRDHSGWGLSPTRHSLDLIVGSIAWKPGVLDGRIEPREILHLTVAFDHEVIDGAPAARFTRRLVELVESGYGLDEVGAS